MVLPFGHLMLRDKTFFQMVYLDAQLLTLEIIEIYVNRNDQKIGSYF